MEDPHHPDSAGKASPEPPRHRFTASRRQVLYGVGVAGLGVGVQRASAQPAEAFELGGEVEAWRGRSPKSIADQANPTLSFQAGQQYAITWENLDGLPHNVVIQDADGEQLVRSELVSEQGATQTVTFTAQPEMTRYLCEVHPNTMVGDVEVSDSTGTQTTTSTTTSTDTTTETATETPNGGAGFFEPGTEVGTRIVAEGMTAPTDHAMPGDDSGRHFVADQTGEVWIVTENGRQDTPFIDVSDRMVTLGEFNGSYADPTQQYDERGLLGIEFHPDFSSNRRFYLHYSAPPNEQTPDGWDHVEVVSEFTASEDGTSGNLDSERVLLQFQKPQYNHDAGPIAFGPDGYLYVPMGDGGGANDDMYGHVEDWYDANAGGNGQDVMENHLGDVLRIDVDSQGEDTPYGVPEDNPFVGTEALDEIYAYGFRNPFGISFDSAGNLFVADAGQNLFEEANVVESGGNYGWNVKEGTHCFSTENPSDPTAITDCPSNAPDAAPYDGGELVDPVVEFPHSYQGESVGITVVGGHRYEASAIPDLQGKYVFGAWTTDPARNQPQGRVLAATPPEGFDDGETTGTGTTTETTTGTPDDGVVPRDRLWDMEEVVVTGGLDYFVRMFGQGPDGSVYVLANKRGIPAGDTGVLLELVPPGDGTQTPTGTTAGTETDTAGNGMGTPIGPDQPGFGFGAAVAGLAGAIAWALKRRLGDE